MAASPWKHCLTCAADSTKCRTDVLSFESLGEDASAYLDWLLVECTEADTDVDAPFEEDC